MKAPETKRISIAVWYPSLSPVGKKLCGPGSPGSAGPGGIATASAGRSTGAVRSRQARAIISTSPSTRSSASSICTRRPGRTIRASTSTGAIGIERRISKVTRQTWKSSASGSSSKLAPEQRRGRPGVLGPGIPGTAGQPRREVSPAVGLVEGGHAAILGTPASCSLWPASG